MKIINRLLIILLILSLVSCGDKATSAKPDETSDTLLEQTSDWSNFQYKIDTDGHVENIMKDLCSDTYLGRVVGTKENEKTQEYIKDYFKTLKLAPFDDNYYISNKDGIISLSENTNNVAAVIKGTDSSKAVYITAHLDHVNDVDNNPLSGAIDNASGIAVLLETAHKLKELTDKSPLAMDVVFVAFNAEELGLLGSQNFFNKYFNNYSESYNINIDCVAQKNCNTLSMGNDDPNSENLYNAMKETFDKENVIYDDSLYATKNGVRYGTSDHIVIRQYGAPSLVLGDSTIMDVVHTNKDNLDNIDYSDLEKLSDTLTKFLITNNGNTFNK
ncbi:Arginyl aminopeptidase [uncultured Clostridium sp.]|uniref:M28 family metallopeptidase n=1 Tax=uncultured Clostridium sp. TaxID=59620 RepID=UPI000820BD83|nr:M28 family metallopeptidase [uncultured Clostridium sp.]SCK03871.1 Arginyl aminopeptidase [uncultured Clostridium sp.]